MRAAPDRDHRTERAALLHAQAQYLAWLETEAPLALAAPEDRKRFNRLVKAIDELLAALGGFGGGSSERALLLHLLQREDGFRGGLRDHSAALGDL
jgi:hypothetical protein